MSSTTWYGDRTDAMMYALVSFLPLVSFLLLNSNHTLPILYYDDDHTLTATRHNIPSSCVIIIHVCTCLH